MSVTPLVDASIPSGQNAEAELRSRQRSIEANRRNINAGNPKDKEAKLRESCEGFEAMFIQKMWEGMRATLPKEGLLHSRDEKQWQSMYDQELGKSMAKSGGIGLADMMVSQLSKNLQSASEVAAGSTARRKPMDIAPAPLMPEAPQKLAKAAPTVALAVGAPGAVGAAGAAGATGTDMYGGPAEEPVAPPPPDATTGSAVAAGTTRPAVNPSPPEVQAALANLAAQAGAAREVGTKAAQQHTAMTEAAFNNLPPSQIPSLGAASGAASGAAVSIGAASSMGAAVSIGAAASMGAAIPAAFTPGSLADRAAGSLATGAVMTGSAARTERNLDSDDIPPSTYRPRVSARSKPIGDQPSRSRRIAKTAEETATPASPSATAQSVSAILSGSNFASMPVYPSAGQNMPLNTMADAAADLMKSQVQPTVKTKL